jgi:peroxiredoxin
VSDPNDIPIDPVSGIEERPQNRREWSGVLRSLLLPVLLVATIVGVLFYIERTRDNGDASDGGYGTVALPDGLNTTGNSPSTEIGRAAPDFLLRTPDGGQLRLSDYRGKPLLVNFWASWCTPCKQEMPEIVKAYAAHRNTGFTVIAVDLQENAGAIQDFAQRFGMDFPIAIDRTGPVAETWRIGGPIQGIPSSYFIDANGIVVDRVFGPMTESTLTQKLESLIDSTP